MTTSRWVGWILGLGATATVIFFLSKGCAEDRTESQKASEAPAITQSAALLDYEKELGLQRWAFDSDRLSVVVSVKHRCGLGDWDAIKLDMEHSAPARLRLSLEPLPPSTLPPQSVELTFEALETGFSHTFDVSRLRPGQAGLYLCKDSEGTGRCSDKKATDLNEVFAAYGVPESQRIGVHPPDRQYFFQYLFLEASQLVSFGKPSLAPEDSLQMGRWVSSKLPEGTDPLDAQRGVEKAVRQAAALTSLKLSRPSGAGNVEVILPRHDRARCDNPRKEDEEGYF